MKSSGNRDSATGAAPSGADRRRASDRGLALISVLWIAILISFVGGAMAVLSTSDARRADALIRRAQAQALADAAFNLVTLQLSREDLYTSNGLITGEPFELALPGGRAAVTLQDESLKPDLNLSEVTELSEMFEKAGADQDEAARLADAVIDFRDEDDLVQLKGAEARDYRAAGLDYEPRNGPFLHVSEVRWVLGVTPEIAERVAAIATALPPPGVPSLPDENLVGLAPAGAPQTLLQQAAATQRIAFRVVVEAETDDGARARIDAVIAPSFQEDELFSVQEWSRH